MLNDTDTLSSLTLDEILLLTQEQQDQLVRRELEFMLVEFDKWPPRPEGSHDPRHG